MNELELIVPAKVGTVNGMIERVLEIEVLPDAPLGSFVLAPEITEGAGAGQSAPITITVVNAPPVELEILGWNTTLRPGVQNARYRVRLTNNTPEPLSCIMYQITARGGAAHNQLDFAPEAGDEAFVSDNSGRPLVLPFTEAFEPPDLQGAFARNSMIPAGANGFARGGAFPPGVQQQYRKKLLMLPANSSVIVETIANVAWSIVPTAGNSTTSTYITTGVAVAPAGVTWAQIPFTAGGTMQRGQYAVGMFPPDSVELSFYSNYLVERQSTTTIEPAQTAPPDSVVELSVIPPARAVQRTKKGTFDVRLRNTAATPRTVDILVRPRNQAVLEVPVATTPATGTQLIPTGSVATVAYQPLYSVAWTNATPLAPNNHYVPIRVTLPAKPDGEPHSEVLRTFEWQAQAATPLGAHEFEVVIIHSAEPDGGVGVSAPFTVTIEPNIDLALTVNDVTVAQGSTATLTTTITNNGTDAASFIVYQRTPPNETTRPNFDGNTPSITAQTPAGAFFMPYKLRETGAAVSQVMVRWVYDLAPGESVVFTSEVSADFGTTPDVYTVVTELWQNTLIQSTPAWQPDVVRAANNAAVAERGSTITVTTGTPDNTGNILISANPNAITMRRGQKKTSTVKVDNTMTTEQLVEIGVFPVGAGAEEFFKRDAQGNFELDPDGRRIPLFRVNWLP